MGSVLWRAFRDVAVCVLVLGYAGLVVLRASDGIAAMNLESLSFIVGVATGTVTTIVAAVALALLLAFLGRREEGRKREQEQAEYVKNRLAIPPYTPPTMKALRSCPFCGAERYAYDPSWTDFVYCRCGAKMDGDPERFDSAGRREGSTAVEKWERRVFTARDVEEMELTKVRREDGRPDYLWRQRDAADSLPPPPSESD